MDLVISPIAVTLNTQSGGSPPALQAGQIVDALVTRVLDPEHLQLALGTSLIEVKTEVPLAPGTRVQFAVKATADGLKLVLLHPPDPAGAPVPGAGSVPDNLAAPAGAGRGSGAMTSAAPLDAPAAARPVASTNLALAAATRSAAATQGGLGPLLADAAVAVTHKGLPEPVRQAAMRLLSFQLPTDTAVEADQLRRAFSRSGLFLEANLDAAAAAPAAPTAGIPADLKSALIALRAALSQWSASKAVTGAAGERAALGAELAIDPQAARTAAAAGLPGAMRSGIGDAQALYRALLQAAGGPLAPASANVAAGAAEEAAGSAMPGAAGPVPSPGHRPPPPYRGAAPVAQAAVPASIGDGDSIERIARTLLADTDAALARQTLLQAASLPDQPGTPAAHADGTMNRWAFEIPFATPQGTSIAQFEIARDGKGRGSDPVGPVWSARFSIDIEPLGAVHAQVAVTGGRTAVTLWAERVESAARLRDNAGLLAEALRGAELEPSELVIRNGSPRPRATAAPAGRFLDCAT